MEVSTSPVWQEAPSAQTVGFVHGTSVHVPRWHPVDAGRTQVPCSTPISRMFLIHVLGVLGSGWCHGG